MIADLHAHYPMHLDPGLRGSVVRLFTTRRGRLRLRDYVRAVGVHVASQFANYPSLFSKPRLTAERMVEGEMRVALSVLYSFFDEFDAGAPKDGDYLAELLRQADMVEHDVRRHHADRMLVATTPAQLDGAGDRLALVHCVEGGFHLLGETEEEVEAAVDALADRGVAYITLAHLIYRGVATGANAFPMLTDRQYAKHCRQPSAYGLSHRGRTAVRAMVRRHVLIDLSHMSERAIGETFELLDELDGDRRVPVLATHSACRLDGTQAYNLSPATVERIRERDGVIGLIMAEHQLYDGLPKARRTTFDDAFEALCTHVDALHAQTGSHRHVAIGSDFDGFIKPTIAGMQDARDFRRLAERLHERYGADADLICVENALRPLRGYWLGAA
jgi:microsomal dipeptidase-like Zn-dependent dipeptidase